MQLDLSKFVTNNLSAGICDNCTVPALENQGDGINEPTDPILYCKKVGIEIQPLPPDEQVKFCIFYNEKLEQL